MDADKKLSVLYSSVRRMKKSLFPEKNTMKKDFVFVKLIKSILGTYTLTVDKRDFATCRGTRSV